MKNVGSFGKSIFLTERELILQLKKQVGELIKENERLRECLSKYEHPKNSSNSSIAPSKDENRPKKNQSLRRSTGKKVGGRPGRKGNTLKMTDMPDVTVDSIPENCRGCGLSLSGMPSLKEGVRQRVDTPPIKAVWTEYRTYSKQYTCGCRTVGHFTALELPEWKIREHQMGAPSENAVL